MLKTSIPPWTTLQYLHVSVLPEGRNTLQCTHCDSNIYHIPWKSTGEVSEEKVTIWCQVASHFFLEVYLVCLILFPEGC